MLTFACISCYFDHTLTFPVDTGHVQVHLQVPQIQSCCCPKTHVSEQQPDWEGGHSHGLHRWVRNYPEIKHLSQSETHFKHKLLAFLHLRIGLAAAQALGSRGAHVVVSSRRQANVDKAVALLRGHDIRVTGTTCNVGKGEDREKLIQTVLSPLVTTATRTR